MKYERIKYPDGQISAKLIEGYPNKGEWVTGRIVERINSYEDLIFVRSIADMVASPKALSLFIPCLFGQRSDRKFSRFQSFDLKLIAEIINSCGFGEVEIFDPHSDVSLALINNSIKKTSLSFVLYAIQRIVNKQKCNSQEIILVSPDAGAYKKVFEYGEKTKLPVIAAVKHRDLDGTIAITLTDDVKDKHCLIVDDICDGGATFISLAKILRLRGAKRVYLYISHAYFSKGLTALRECIDHIYCTNSVKEFPDMWFDGMNTVQVKNFVTQFEVI